MTDLINALNDIQLIVEVAMPNIEALTADTQYPAPKVIVETAAAVLSTLAIKVGAGKEVSDQEVNSYIALKILASPINRNLVNVKPPLMRLLIQRAGVSPDVDDALQKLSGHPEFREIRKSVVDAIAAAATDPEKAKGVAGDISRLQVGYSRLVDKLNGLTEVVCPGVVELVEMGNGVSGTRITGNTTVRSIFEAYRQRTLNSTQPEK